MLKATSLNGFNSRSQGCHHSRCREDNTGAAPRQRQRNFESANGRASRQAEVGARSAPRQQRQRRSDSASERRKPATAGAPATSPAEIPVVRVGQGSSSTFFTSEQFKDIGASDEVVQALASIGIKRPSHVQVSTHPPAALGYKNGLGSWAAHLS